MPTRELAYTPFVVNMRPFYEDADRQLRLIGDTSWLDLDKLAGFPEWASDFLDANPSMYDRTDFIYQAPPCPSRPENAHKDISVKASREEAAPSLLFPCRLGS